MNRLGSKLLNPVYFIDCGTYKEIIRDDKMLFKCPFCGLWFRGLAYHTSQKHGINTKDFRKLMGLKSNYQLTTPDIKARHREIALQNADKHIKENLIIKGKQTRYKKGYQGHIKDNWSAEALAKANNYKKTRNWRTKQNEKNRTDETKPTKMGKE